MSIWIVVWWQLYLTCHDVTCRATIQELMGERDNELGCMHARCPTWISASWILLDTSQRGHCRPHATVWCLHCSAIEWFHCTIGALRAVVVLHKGIFLHEWVHVRRCPLFVQIIENLYGWFLRELSRFFSIKTSGLFNIWKFIEKLFYFLRFSLKS